MTAAAGARVTVFIPTYNRAHWLRQSIGSVLAQTYADLLLVVADNASSDQTGEVVASFSDPRVRYVRRLENIGLFNNHDGCLRTVATEYALILPDDDLLAPEHLERTVAVLDANPGAGIVHTAFDVIGPAGELVSEAANWTFGLTTDRVETGVQFIRESMIWSCRVCPSTTLIRRAAIPPEPFNEADLPGIDFGLWLRIALDWDVAFVSRSLARFRVHPSSHSASFGPSLNYGYVQRPEAVVIVRELKRRFLDDHAERIGEGPHLHQLAERAMRRELVQLMRNTTLPERRFGATMRAFSSLARVDRRMLRDLRAWRLVAASLVGRRTAERLKSFR